MQPHAIYSVPQLTGTVTLVGDVVGTINVPVALLLQGYALSIVTLPGISGTCFFDVSRMGWVAY